MCKDGLLNEWLYSHCTSRLWLAYYLGTVLQVRTVFPSQKGGCHRAPSKVDVLKQSLMMTFPVAMACAATLLCQDTGSSCQTLQDLQSTPQVPIKSSGHCGRAVSHFKEDFTAKWHPSISLNPTTAHFTCCNSTKMPPSL